MKLISQNDEIVVSFSYDELEILVNGLHEFTSGVRTPDNEFQTRMGVERAEARKVVRELNELLSSLK